MRIAWLWEMPILTCTAGAAGGQHGLQHGMACYSRPIARQAAKHASQMRLVTMPQSIALTQPLSYAP